ncbi:hypothetical protein Droror1_Dr00015753 [Drosera rotundifolia]
MESLDNEVLEELRRRDLLVRLLVVAGSGSISIIAEAAGLIASPDAFPAPNDVVDIPTFDIWPNPLDQVNRFVAFCYRKSARD